MAALRRVTRESRNPAWQGSGSHAFCLAAASGASGVSALNACHRDARSAGHPT
ncbi:hypothetical protein HMPREF0321_0355 [Dermacoccus sp. Ellin185]|nr:hypothetical protein HMPREF0321_0355 [Dermacoccus sp. Ellin185]